MDDVIGFRDYVKIGKGRKVYQVVDTGLEYGDRVFKLAPTAEHPDAAVRIQDAFRWYHSSELMKVGRR